MNIILTDIANLVPMVIPIVPKSTSLTFNSDNNESDTLSGYIRIMGNTKLRSLSWNSIFPVNKDYDFVNPASLKNGWDYVSFLNLMRECILPIRVICTTSKFRPISNVLMSIDEFSYKLDGVEDIEYSISLTEFPVGFFDFVARRKEAEKYIKLYIENSTVGNILKRNGLIQ